MKRKLTYKQRLLYTLIGSFIFSIVVYNLALSDTISLAVENSELEELISKSQDAPEKIQFAKQKIKRIEQLVGTNTVYNEVDIHQVLLEAVTSYVQTNGLILKDFPQPYVAVNNGYITKTVQVTVEGDFVPLLKLIYFLETDYSVGKIVAVDFKTAKERRTRKRKLNTTIYLHPNSNIVHQCNVHNCSFCTF